MLMIYSIFLSKISGFLETMFIYKEYVDKNVNNGSLVLKSFHEVWLSSVYRNKLWIYSVRFMCHIKLQDRKLWLYYGKSSKI